MTEAEMMDAGQLTDVLSESARDEGPVLVLVESDDGLAGEVSDLIPDEMGPVERVAGAVATRGKVGCVADSIELDDLSGRALIVENAQWIDPTSMGRIERIIASADSNLLVVVAHRPLEHRDSWWLDDLVTVADRHGRVITAERQSSSTEPPALPEDDRQRDLVLATRLVSDPIPVAVVAGFLGVTEPEALELAERLVEQDLLAEARSGFRATASGLAVEAGEARLGHVAGRLAAAFENVGGDKSVIGSLLIAAGDGAAAYPLLRDAAREAQARSAAGEAHYLAEAALDAADDAAVGTESEIGELHLISGRHLRAAGRSEAAADHLEEAVALLEGNARIDALGFAAAVADDRQHPQESERRLAVAEWEAARQGEHAKLGSLGTFRARALNRIGFAAEADAVMDKSMTLLEQHGTATQRFYAETNRAWIDFDRGLVAKAEAGFTHLRDLTDAHDLAGLADKEAWRARALFAAGHPSEAVEAVERARDLATRADVEAPLFLADLALAEGNLLYGRFEEALAAADRVWDLVARQLFAWENVARLNRALALLRLGRVAEAELETVAALEATPAGADGWRWRSRCRAVQIEVAAAAGKPFPQRQAEELADLFLQSELWGWAAELMCVIAEQTRGDEVAREAMALAIQIGNPMLAVRAAKAGSLWRDPVAAPMIRAAKAVEGRLPDGWADTWREVPGVTDALAAPEPEEGDTGAEASEVLEEALERAGLASPDGVLSPAQRRSRGLVRHRRRRRGPLTLAAAALGVIVLAVGTSLAVAQFSQPDPTPPTAAAAETPDTTAPPPPSLEETQVELPVEQLFGVAQDRGDNGRSGYVDVSGPRTVDGYYWVFEAADAITATPLAYGNNLLVGSADGTFQAINLTDGGGEWSLATDDQIDASGAFSTVQASTDGDGAAPVGEGATADGGGTAVIVGDDGFVRARDALTVNETQIWATPLGARIKSSPIVDNGVVYVATVDGFVHALDLANGQELWRYPVEGDEPLSRVTADLTLADGILYVGDESGRLTLLDRDGTLVCESPLDAPIVVNPVVVDGLAYISYGRVIRIVDAGTCPAQTLTDSVQFLSESVVDVAPAVVGDLMYIPNAQFLNAVDRLAVEQGVSSPEEAHHWSEGKVRADGKIASPPVVTNDAVYFGTETGSVYAVDSDTGDPLWEEPWKTGNYVRASPVVIEGAVYVASGDGNVYALGPGG
ncbi:MAG: PQQ-binding-like beta-propeller repeat protein [Actinomycetota bacterium]